MDENEDLQRGQEAAAPAEKVPPEPDRVVVNLDEVDDDEPEKGKESPPGKSPRYTSRRDFRRQREELERQLAERDAKLADLGEKFARLEGRLSASGPSGHARGEPDNSGNDELKQLDRQQRAIGRAIQAARTDQEAEELTQDWRELETRRRKIEAARNLDELLTARGIKPGASATGVSEDQYIATVLSAEFPQIFASQALNLRAQAEVAEMMERGRPRSLATAREACQRVLGRAGIGAKPPAPTDLERSRLSGVPSRAGANGGGANTYTPNAFEMSLARAFTQDQKGLTDQQRYLHWARATGNLKREAG